MCPSTKGIFIKYPKHTEQSINYDEEPKEGPPKGVGFYFVGFFPAVFPFYLKKNPDFELGVVY